ncbi:MAG: hypothetical protein ACRC67_25255 [Inquilinus sp.]|uniref:hypothetical protein n=1 Tax=Inquilinus sp. TaxID=1932117 RepID=UPI003F2C9381
MTERIVDVFDKNSVRIITYTVRITAFNRTLCCDDFEREALWMASRDKIAPDNQLTWLTAKVQTGRC